MLLLLLACAHLLHPLLVAVRGLLVTRIACFSFSLPPRVSSVCSHTARCAPRPPSSCSARGTWSCLLLAATQESWRPRCGAAAPLRSCQQMLCTPQQCKHTPEGSSTACSSGPASKLPWAGTAAPAAPDEGRQCASVCAKWATAAGAWPAWVPGYKHTYVGVVTTQVESDLYEPTLHPGSSKVAGCVLCVRRLGERACGCVHSACAE
jgi:hypothetical protein